MKISDLLEDNLNEWQPCKPPHFTQDEMPDIRWAKKVSTISVEIGQFPVYELYNGNYLTFIAYDEKLQKVVTFATVQILKSPYGQLTDLYSFVQESGLASALVTYIVRDRQPNMKLFSDFLMSNLGGKFWHSLINKSSLKVSVIDIDTAKQYNINDVKTNKLLTDDGEIVLLPDNDKRPPKPENMRWRTTSHDANFQRFLYITEAEQFYYEHPIYEKYKEVLSDIDDHPIFSKNDKPTVYLKPRYEFGNGDL